MVMMVSHGNTRWDGRPVGSKLTADFPSPVLVVRELGSASPVGPRVRGTPDGGLAMPMATGVLDLLRVSLQKLSITCEALWCRRVLCCTRTLFSAYRSPQEQQVRLSGISLRRPTAIRCTRVRRE